MPTTASSNDDPRLDHPGYWALSGLQARFAQRHGRMLRYARDVAPFLAPPPDVRAADWQDAAELVPPGTVAAAIHDGSPLPASLRVTHRFDLVQMVGERTRAERDPETVTLTSEDVPEMSALVRLTEPGPFLERTIELGRYVGIRRDGALVAMAGERMHFEGWTEISAVCTVPEQQGQGLASRLISTLLADIEQRSERVFLQVLTSNVGAIRLYEQLGFRARRGGTVTVITRREPA